MRFLRWILAIPLGFVASVLAGVAGGWFAHFYGQPTWWVHLISGVASGVSFFWVAYRVAPAANTRLKWILVCVVGILGVLSFAGPIIARKQWFQSLEGLGMMLMAVVYSRQSKSELAGHVVVIPASD